MLPSVVLFAAIASSLAGQKPQSLSKEVVADFRKYASCDESRRQELDEILRAGFGVPPHCDLKLLTFKSPLGAARATAPGEARVSIEVALSRRPKLKVKVLGSLDPSSHVRFGRGRSFGPDKFQRSTLSRLMMTTRSVVHYGDSHAVDVTACKVIWNTTGTRAGFKFAVPSGSAVIETRLNLSIEPAEQQSLIKTVEDWITKIREVAVPFVSSAANCSVYQRAVGVFRVSWRGVGFEARHRKTGWVYQACGVELSVAALGQIADTIEQHRKLGKGVWKRSWTVTGLVEDRGFLVLHCPKSPPQNLPADGWDNWLSNNAQATLLLPEYDSTGAVTRLRSRHLRLKVRGGVYPRPFDIVLGQINLRVRWANSRKPPKLDGTGFKRF